MAFLVAMTLPALVIGLTVLGAWEVLRARRRGEHGAVMASTGFDLVQEALYPSKRHEIEQRDHESLIAEDDADGARPRSWIDLAAGTAHLRLR